MTRKSLLNDEERNALLWLFKDAYGDKSGRELAELLSDRSINDVIGKDISRDTFVSRVSEYRNGKFPKRRETLKRHIALLDYRDFEHLLKDYRKATGSSSSRFDIPISQDIRKRCREDDNLRRKFLQQKNEQDYRNGMGAIVYIRDYIKRRGHSLPDVGKPSRQVIIEKSGKRLKAPKELISISVNPEGPNNTKYILGGTIPKGDLIDSEGSHLRLILDETDWHTVSRTDEIVFQRNDAGHEARLKFGALDPEHNVVPYNFTGLYILRFSDGSVLAMKRSPRVKYYPNTLDISGGEQFKPEDLRDKNRAIENWARRAIFEEVFPFRRSEQIQDLIQEVSQSFFGYTNLLSIGYCVLDCSYPIFVLIQSEWTSNQYLNYIQDVLDKDEFLSFDKEGQKLIMTQNQLVRYARGHSVDAQIVYDQTKDQRPVPGKSGESLKLQWSKNTVHPMTPARLHMLFHALEI